MSNDRPLEDAVHELSARCQRNGRDALARAMLETAIDRVTMAMSPPPGARDAVARARHIMGEIDAGRRDRDDGKGNGRTKPAIADFAVAATGREPTTFDAIVERVKRYVSIDDDAKPARSGR